MTGCGHFGAKVGRNTLDHFYADINRMYMALMMVAPMVILILLVMRAIYPDQKLNYILLAAFTSLFILIFSLARTQTLVGNEQILRSMIPHHSSAILMCEHSAINDPEIIDLCDEIVQAQKQEINQMRDTLSRINE